MLLLLPFILSFALALPNQDPPQASCIRMTSEKEKQIDIIVEKLGNFLANNLTIEHENFDIRLIKLAIEQHSEKEEEEKETLLQLSVNDCQLTDDELEKIDHHREKARELREKQTKEEREARKKELIKEEEIEDLKDYDTKPKPKIMNLDLDENGMELVEALNKNKRKQKRPLVIYVQKDNGQLDYLFSKRR